MTTKTEQARFNMVEQQIRPWNVFDERVLSAMMSIPRELFVAEEYQPLAYSDTSLPLDHEQSMLPPREVARLLQAANIQPDETVLEIGTGSGYVTALMAQLARTVYSVDIFPDFVTQAQQNLQSLELNNVTIESGDAVAGWSYHAPYDVIIITAALAEVPQTILESLNVGGRLVCYIGQAPVIQAVCFTKQTNNEWQEEPLFETEVDYLVNAKTPEAFQF